MILISSAALNILPPVARAFCQELVTNEEAARIHHELISRRLNETLAKIAPVRAAIEGDDEAPRAARTSLASLEGDAASSRASQRVAAAKANSLTGALAAVSRFLDPLTPGHLDREARVTISDVPRPKPKGDLASIQAEIAGLLAQQREIERTQLSRGALEPTLRRLVETMGERGKPTVVGLDGRGHIRVASGSQRPLELLSWLHPEDVTQRLLGMIGEGGLSTEERSAALADIAKRIDKAERLEAAICVAERAPWRRGISAQAILSVTVAASINSNAA